VITPLRILLLLLACTSFLALPAHAQKLPDTITTITVDAVQSDAIHVTKVGGTDMLQDKDVKRFIAAWNSLKTRPGDNHCATHPEYRLCFYQTSSKVYGYVAICFACHAIFRLDSENPDHFQDELLFNDDSAAKELHEMLSRMFPGHEARK
jgi:hypothetical protein